MAHTLSPAQYAALESAAERDGLLAVGSSRTLMALERKGLVANVTRHPGWAEAHAYLTSAGIDVIESGS